MTNVEAVCHTTNHEGGKVLVGVMKEELFQAVDTDRGTGW